MTEAAPGLATRGSTGPALAAFSRPREGALEWRSLLVQLVVARERLLDPGPGAQDRLMIAPLRPLKKRLICKRKDCGFGGRALWAAAIGANGSQARHRGPLTHQDQGLCLRFRHARAEESNGPAGSLFLSVPALSPGHRDRPRWRPFRSPQRAPPKRLTGEGEVAEAPWTAAFGHRDQELCLFLRRIRTHHVSRGVGSGRLALSLQAVVGVMSLTGDRGAVGRQGHFFTLSHRYRADLDARTSGRARRDLHA